VTNYRIGPHRTASDLWARNALKLGEVGLPNNCEQQLTTVL